jgi:hypothetical protein
MGALIKIQRRQAMLAVNDEKLVLGRLQMAHVFVAVERAELQGLRREQQHGPGNGRLRDGGLVKIADGFHF